MDIPDVRAAVIEEIKGLLLLLTGPYPMRELGEEFEKLSECFPALGICYLLENADTDRFRENLVRSGHGRRFFLRQSRNQGNVQDFHLAISRTESLLDVLAAGNLPLAQEIAQASRVDWEPAGEYEDDFCYYRFLHLVVESPDMLPEQELADVLARFERALEGAPAVRLDLCKALLARNPDDLGAALGEFLQQKQDAADEKRPYLVDSDFLFWPRSFVSVEGLALLKLAEIFGMLIEEEFPLCPELGRLANASPAYTDFFQEIDNARTAGP